MTQTDRDAGAYKGGLTTEQKEELSRRREVKVLRQEKEILRRAAAWIARERNSIPERDSIPTGAPGYTRNRADREVVNHKRVGRLIREKGLVGATRRRKWRTTLRN